VLAARNEDALRLARDRLEALGARVEYVVADVSDREQVREIAARAQQAFGGFDTWINDAAASVYGPLMETPVEDMRRVFETNFWGMVYGSIEAVEHLRGKEGGGKLINVGSVLSDFSVPEQGIYAASKHAVKGFTNALRMELMRAKTPVSVTLIKPSGIATPYKDHARNYMDDPARVPAPLYGPNVVADAILYACEHNIRDLTVGAAGRQMELFEKLLPGLADRLYASVAPALQKDLRPGQHVEREGNLYEPMEDGEERTDSRFVRNFSVYTAAQTHPRTTAALALLAGVAAAGALSRGRRH
jgi:short-subunit dehydrogenase